jgi:predicted nucleotidyltransferase
MEDVLNQLLEKLTKALGDRLVSVVLYGSAVTGDHHEKFSDLNILCVLQQVTSRELADAEQFSGGGARRRIQRPCC